MIRASSGALPTAGAGHVYCGIIEVEHAKTRAGAAQKQETSTIPSSLGKPLTQVDARCGGQAQAQASALGGLAIHIEFPLQA